MKSFRKFTEAKVGDNCSCCDNKIDENGKCGCGPDCQHCGGQHSLDEYTNWSVRHPTKPTKSYKVKARGTGEALKKAHKAAVKAGDLHPNAPHDSMQYKHVKKEDVNEALRNPYQGKPERDLKRKLASFESQLQDLIKKSRGRQRKEIEGEIRDMETKVQQVRAALREDVKEALGEDYGAMKDAQAHAKKDGQNYDRDVSVQHRYDAHHMKKRGYTHFKTTRFGGREYNKHGIGTKIGPEHTQGVKEEISPASKAIRDAGKKADAKAAGIGRSGETYRDRQKRLGQTQTESLSEEQINDITAQYINENNISMAELEAMSQEQLDEIIGKAIGGAFKLGAKAAVGTARLAGKGIKKTAKRMSTAGRADAAEKKAKALEQKQKDRERMQAAKQRVRDLKQKQADAKRKQNQQQQNKPKTAQVL